MGRKEHGMDKAMEFAALMASHGIKIDYDDPGGSIWGVLLVCLTFLIAWGFLNYAIMKFSKWRWRWRHVHKGIKMTSREREAYVKMALADMIEEGFEKMFEEGRIEHSEINVWRQRLGNLVGLTDLMPKNLKPFKQHLKEKDAERKAALKESVAKAEANLEAAKAAIKEERPRFGAKILAFLPGKTQAQT
jgi:hypothetical protein